MVEAEDCHTVDADPYCRYININAALDERIIVFYLYYELHTGPDIWTSDYRGTKPVFTNYGWVNPDYNIDPPVYMSQGDVTLIA